MSERKGDPPCGKRTIIINSIGQSKYINCILYSHIEHNTQHFPFFIFLCLATTEGFSRFTSEYDGAELLAY